jgi:hypothetical protein
VIRDFREESVIEAVTRFILDPTRNGLSSIEISIPMHVQVPTSPDFDHGSRLVERDARMVSTIHASVKEQGVGEHLQPYSNELESAEKENTRSRSLRQGH